MKETQDLSNAVVVGLNTLSNEDVRVPSKDIEALANFKGILKALLNGELVLASPDRIIPEGTKISEKPESPE